MNSKKSITIQRTRLTKSNKDQFVRRTAVVLQACILILFLLPGFANAQDWSTVEKRAAWLIEQYRDDIIEPNGKSAPAPALARLALNPDDAYVIDMITHFYDGNPPKGDPRMFSGPGIAWILGKYWDKFTLAQRDHLKANLKAFADLLDHGTENHALMRNVAAYLFAQYWPDESGWLGGTMTSTEMGATARANMLAVMRSLYDKGYEENLSHNYAPVHLYPYYALYECATDPEMKSAADAALHFHLANLAANHFEGVPIPPANRDYPTLTWNTYTSGKVPAPSMPWIHWLYWIDAQNWTPTSVKNSSSTYAAVSSWRPTAAIESLSLGQTIPYELTSSAPSFGHAGVSPGSWGTGTPGECVRYVYRDKLYAMGSGFFQYYPEEFYVDYTAFRLIYKSPDRFNFIECYHPYWRSNDRTWQGLNSPFQQWAQHKGTAIALFNIPTTDPWAGRGRADWQLYRNEHFNNLIQEALLRYPKTIDQKTEANGWIFLREGGVYIAIRPLKDYTIDTNYLPASANFHVIRSAFAQTGFVFDIATKEEFISFEAFQTAVNQNPPLVDWDQLSVTYTNVRGETLTSKWNPPDYDVPEGKRVLVRPDITVNGVEVPVDNDFINGRAAIKSTSVGLVDRVLQLQTPAGELVVDWRGDYPIIGGYVNFHAAQLEFTDSVSGKPVEGLEVILQGKKYETDTLGMISIPEIIEGSYKLAVTDSRYIFTVDPVIEIRSDSLFRFQVKRMPQLTLRVINRTSGASVYRAAVKTEEKTYPSDDSGFVNIGAYSPGAFIFSVEHRDYFSVSDTLFVSSDTTILISLTPLRADVTFSFSDINGPMSGVKVTLSGSQYTNSSGEALFFSLPARENFSWSAEKSGYYTLQDTFYLETDTSLQVTMELSTMIQEKTGDNHFLVYPVPAYDYLVIDAEISVASPVKIDLVTVSGISVFSAQDVTLPYILRPKGMNPGIYILKIHSPEGCANQLITVK